jgi:hypothetical protein
MTINRHNYEMFLIDYLDGKLNPLLVAELMDFLEQNPAIKEELDGLQDAVLVSEEAIYPNKSNLKKKSFLKNGIDNEFEYLCISSVEGSLDDEEKVALDTIVENDQNKRKEFEAFKKSPLKPDLNLRYKQKSQLKRVAIVPIRHSTLKASIGVAASIALLLGIYSVGKMLIHINPPNEIMPSQIASSEILVKSPIPVKVIKSSPTLKVTAISNKTEKGNNEHLKEIVSESSEIAKEEFIPNKISGLEPKEISTLQTPQIERLAIKTANYNNTSDILNEHLYAMQETNISSSNTKEIGVFEIIQYGVQKFGRLIGKDIKLNAKKDKKGNIEKIDFESNLIAFSTPIRKNE